MRVKKALLPFFFISAFALAPLCAAQVTVQPHVTPAPQQAEPQRTPQEQAAEVGKYSGPGSCAASNCHGGVQPNTVVRISQNEYSIWAGQDKHARRSDGRGHGPRPRHPRPPLLQVRAAAHPAASVPTRPSLALEPSASAVSMKNACPVMGLAAISPI